MRAVEVEKVVAAGAMERMERAGRALAAPVEGQFMLHDNLRLGAAMMGFGRLWLAPGLGDGLHTHCASCKS